MLRFYQAADSLEAQLVIDYLAASHIRATVLGQYQAGAAGELSALTYPWVWLLEARDRARAQQLLDEFLERRDQGGQGQVWVCAQCGTTLEAAFDLCWQCGSGRPL